MQVIKVEDLSEEQLSSLKSFTNLLSEKYNRVIKFTIICEDDEIDYVTYYLNNDENMPTYFLREANHHQLEDVSSIENFCKEYEVLLRSGKSLDYILSLDEENILNFTTDINALRRARQ